MTTATPAKTRSDETALEGTQFGYRASAFLDGRCLASEHFTAKLDPKTLVADVDSAYAAAKAFLAPFEPSCPDCGTHFSPGPGARCDCGACRG